MHRNSSAFYPWFRFPGFQLSAINLGLQADEPPSNESSEGQLLGNSTSQRVRHSPHFISPRRRLTISHRHQKGESNTMIFGETDHIYITFMTVYCENCSMLLLVIVNL